MSVLARIEHHPQIIFKGRHEGIGGTGPVCALSRWHKSQVTPTKSVDLHWYQIGVRRESLPMEKKNPSPISSEQVLKGRVGYH